MNKEVGESHKQCNSEVSKENATLRKTTFIDKRAILEYPINRKPIQVFVNYNEQRKQVEFIKNFYTCTICFTDKLGKDCTQFLPCAHTFCKDCIRSYFEIRIKEGNVQNISCPQETCKFEASPGQIKDLVSSELFSKYDSILLSTALDTMIDIVYCPRRQCQYPVTRELDEQMATCPACLYTFCVRCKRVYHGIHPCEISSAEKQRLMSEYQSASNEKKELMERRYGKRHLESLIENTMSENWINDNSRNCPHCNSAIEKSDGCNKIICFHCGTYFCWLCGMELNLEMPYVHFNNPGSKCNNMLYHGVPLDEFEVDELDDEDGDFDLNAVYLDYYYANDEDIYDERNDFLDN